MSYTLPQVQVFQIFRQLPQNVVKNLNAFIFGPHYQLFRYSVAAEKELILLGAYEKDADVTYPWPNQPTNSVVDLGYVKLYAENVWAEYLAITTGAEAQIVSESERNKVRVEDLVLQKANGYTRSAGILRDVAVGDRVRYSYTDLYDVTHTGTTKIVGVEADMVAAVIGDANAKASNQDDVVATADLDTGATAPVTTPSGVMTLSAVYALAGIGSDDQFPGLLSAGVVEDTITIAITTGGAKGTARATVTYASGMYTRENVLIEAAGSQEGQIYLGNNVYLEFEADSGEDTDFSEDDEFTVELAAAFTKPDTTTFGVPSDDYTGASGTTYVLEVVRGGLFDRTVTVSQGLTNVANKVLQVGPGDSTTPNWSTWLGGDYDDEYILRCVGAGIVTVAKFTLVSQRGDNESNVTFSAADADVTIGNRGLVAQLPAGDYSVGDYWVIRVNASRPQIKITDTAGSDATQFKTVADGVLMDIGAYGVEFTPAANSNAEGGVDVQGGLRLGDVYYITCTPAVADAVKTMVFADSLASGIPAGVDIALWLYLVKNGVEVTGKRTQVAPDYNWQGDVDDGITVYQDLQVQDNSWETEEGEHLWLDVYSAMLYVEYRALLNSYTDTIHVMTDISDVATMLGTVHPDNPLTQGVYNALLNSGNRAVYYMGVPSVDAAGWSVALDKATLSEDVYVFVPLTSDSAVLDLVTAHIDTLSTETEKHWRIGFYGATTPTEDPIYTRLANPAGKDFLAQIALDTETNEYTLLTFVDEDGDPTTYTEALDDLRAGDKVRINFATDAWGDATYAEYEVDTVLTNTTLRLEAGPANEIDMPTKVEVVHPYTLAETADAAAVLSSGYFNRRIYNVFPSQLGANGVVMTGEFGAAAVAGLASSVPPQQPITNIEVNGFDDLPLVYQTYNRTQLNKMAEYGTMILMQDTAGGRIYVRHQVSTRAKDGNLNTTELSITKNLDSISYFLAAMFAPYIGRYNITPELIEVLRTQLVAGLNYLGSLTSVGNLGPQLNLTQTEIVELRQHPLLEDHVVATVNLGMPKPFNVLQLKLVV